MNVDDIEIEIQVWAGNGDVYIPGRRPTLKALGACTPGRKVLRDNNRFSPCAGFLIHFYFTAEGRILPHCPYSGRGMRTAFIMPRRSLYF